MLAAAAVWLARVPVNPSADIVDVVALGAYLLLVLCGSILIHRVGVRLLTVGWTLVVLRVLWEFLDAAAPVNSAIAQWVSDLLEPLGALLMIAGFYAYYRKRAKEVYHLQRTEEALRLSGEYARGLVEYVSDVVALIDADGSIRYVTPSVEQALCHKPGELAKRQMIDLLHPDDRAEYVDRIKRTNQVQRTTEALEIRMQHKDRTWRTFEATINNRLDDASMSAYVLTAHDITLRKRTEEDLTASREQYQRLVETAGVIPWEFSFQQQRFVYVGPQAEKILGYPASYWLERDFWPNCIYEPDRPQALRYFYTQPSEDADREYRLVRADGALVWVRDIINVVTHEGKPTLLHGFMVDITERRKAESAMRASEERFRGYFEQSLVGMALLTRDWRFTEVNDALAAMLGCTKQELLGREWQTLLPPEEAGASLEALRNVTSRTGRTGATRDMRFLTDSGQVLNTLVSVRANCGEGGRLLGFQLLVQDITERKQLEDELMRNAFHDPLTGLRNRAWFLERLDQVFHSNREGRAERYAVLFLDLDDFKVVNDSLGHLVGDQLLVMIAKRVESCLREMDTVARLGGDEFGVIVEGLRDSREAERVSEKLRRKLTSSFKVGEHEIYTSVSIGIALSDERYQNPKEMLRDADTAMYKAKSAGRGSCAIFDPVMHRTAMAQLTLEADLRRAIERDEFTLHYQEIRSLRMNELVGFEALLRWNHPEKGLLLPDQFLQVADDTGMIVPIGSWVLNEACRTLTHWRAELPADSPISLNVNLAGKQFAQPDLVKSLASVFADTGVDPRHLHLEITETAMMRNDSDVHEKLHALRDLGLQLAIDDFGTGYSSLGRLRHFPISTVKVDRLFVEGLGKQRGESAFLSAIITLARHLNMEIVAEGVENAVQYRQLQLLGCDYGQGFYFSRALPGDEAMTRVRDAGRGQYPPQIPDSTPAEVMVAALQ